MDDAALQRKAYEIRRKTLSMIYTGGAGHVGGDMSAADILTVLFYHVMRCDASRPDWPERDRYVQSKGHCVEVYLTILADRGYFPEEELKTYGVFGSRFIGHPTRKIPGIEICTGALGHGLSAGVGMALGARMNEIPTHVYVLTGDGELAEGSIWEAAMAANNYRLENLTAIVDRNHLQISGDTEDVMRLEPLKQKWEAFGFHFIEIDGHDIAAIRKALLHRETGKPVLVLAHTVKGKGISYMERSAKWHHGVPDAVQFAAAMKELEAKT
jgi:transketolase